MAVPATIAANDAMGTRNFTVASPFESGAGVREQTSGHRANFHACKCATSIPPHDRDFGRWYGVLHEVKICRRIVWRIICSASLAAVICVFSPKAALSEAAPDLSAFAI